MWVITGWKTHPPHCAQLHTYQSRMNSMRNLNVCIWQANASWVAGESHDSFASHFLPNYDVPCSFWEIHLCSQHKAYVLRAHPEGKSERCVRSSWGEKWAICALSLTASNITHNVCTNSTEKRTNQGFIGSRAWRLRSQTWPAIEPCFSNVCFGSQKRNWKEYCTHAPAGSQGEASVDLFHRLHMHHTWPHHVSFQGRSWSRDQGRRERAHGFSTRSRWTVPHSKSQWKCCTMAASRSRVPVRESSIHLVGV